MVTRVKRRNKIDARNFIKEQANLRLKEVVGAAQQISTNSVFVHASPIMYFARVKSGVKCNCREKVSLSGNVLPTSSDGIGGVESVTIDASSSLFGSLKQLGEQYQEINNRRGEDVDSDALDDEIASLGDDYEAPAAINNLTGGSVKLGSLFNNATDCPICLRAGTLPGYQPLGHTRHVLSSPNFVDSDGYFVDSSQTVSPMVHSGVEESFVEYELVVPLVFLEAKVGVFNGKLVSDAQLFYRGVLVDEGVLCSLKGNKIKVRVMGGDFTHAVVQFKVSSTVYKGDFPQDTRPKDYSIFDSTQPVTIVTDKSIPAISTDDIVYKEEYNSFWKVTDFEYFRLNDSTVIGWSLTARLLQDDEIQKLLVF